MDSGDKATNKAMSIAFKYACFQVFCIPTEEMIDPDKDTPEPIKEKKTEDKPTTVIEPVKSNPAPSQTLFNEEFNDEFNTDLPILCEDCHNPITATTTKTLEQVIEGSKKVYGKELCQHCKNVRWKQAHPDK
jgi:hypothetical protein